MVLPSCLKKRIAGRAGYLLVLPVLLTVGTVGFLAANGGERGETGGQTFQQGETVRVEDLSYTVASSRWSSRLTEDDIFDEEPDAMFLFVEMTVKNDGKKPAEIPEFALVDESGYEYAESEYSALAEGAILSFEKLNPGVTRQGCTVFDVPTGHQYKLQVSGGDWSREAAFIELSPK
ncbi:MAG: DUF4352 domain-containing protein [Phycisphaerae bacterium]|nr:DUF4352 domain-containing protein [Phycisphaerae bacterium]